jgi:Flp pilus assembly protein TadB
VSAASWVAVASAGLAVALCVPVRPHIPSASAPPSASPTAGWMVRGRLAWAALGAVAAAAFLGGSVGLLMAPVVGVATWIVIGRAEPPAVRREREAARRDLPHLVGLLGDALHAGRSPVDAVSAVVEALPGPASDRLGSVLPRLRLGSDPGDVWGSLASDDGLAPLGRTLARAHVTGASVVAAIDRLSDELARDSRAEVEDRARGVGVKAALPLGLCLLPAFVLLGIVPVVAGLLAALHLG